MAKSVLLIRHGQSTFNAAYAESGEDPMDYDAPLSRHGEAQVRALKDRLGKRSFDLAVTTPYTRAIQTCLGLFDGRDLPVRVEALHGEQVGASCDIGRSPKVLAATYPTLTFAHLDDPWWYVEPAAGRRIVREPSARLMDRVDAFRAWLDKRPEERIAVVGHVMFFSALSGHVLENCGTVEFQS